MLKKATLGIKTKDGLEHDENQYLHLIEDILNEGELIEGRNGITKTIFGSAMHFSLENNTIPLLTAPLVFMLIKHLKTSRCWGLNSIQRTSLEEKPVYEFIIVLG